MSRFTPTPHQPPPPGRTPAADGAEPPFRYGTPVTTRALFGRLRIPDWFRRMPLRRRLAVLTAAAVAVAVAVSAFSCWLLVRRQLDVQRDTTLQNIITLRADRAMGIQDAVAQFCGDRLLPPGLKQSDATPTVISPALVGFSCPTTDTSTVEPSAADLAVATQPGSYDFHDGKLLDGTAVRVYTRNIGPGVALSVATPSAPVDSSLNALAVLLAVVAACGVVIASSAGLLVARTALRPVDQLTEAVEHIARTEEVGTTIPVEGKDEIARLSESFNSMSTALSHSRERQTRLIADAGHELRTPLTSLRTNVELLVRSDETGRPLPAETRSRMLGNMKAQMTELSTLIGDLLELSRPTRGRSSREIAVVALHDIAARAVDRGRLRGPGLRFDVALEPWYVRGEAHALERAVINLLDNAVKYSPPKGTVDVVLSRGQLTVRDRGPGIASEELPYVFDRFWRSPSSRQLPGSGLGLSIVAQAIRDSGGEVTLGPAADGLPGALATVRLPGAPISLPGRSIDDSSD